MDMGVVGVPMVDRDPVEPGFEVARHVVHEFAGEGTKVCHIARILGRHDDSEMVAVIVAALGKPEFVTADMVKEGAVVIDVGISRVPDETKKRGYAIRGDVKFDEVKEVAGFITPVPGGVGPMTIAMLMRNTARAAEIQDP